jgi:lactoylglutathione lyase
MDRTALFREIHHTALNVTDMDRSLKFYKNILGLEAMFEPQEASGEQFERATEIPGAKIKFTMLKIGGGDTFIELIQYVNPQAKPNELKISDTGAPHVAFRVDNIDEAKANLESKGVKFNSDPVRIVAGPLKGRSFVYFKDPDGLTLELFEELKK